MTIEVEDGTGKADAVSYASAAHADAYHTLRGNTAWTALTTEVKEAYLVQATDYAEQRWGLRYPGVRSVEGQALSWPRDEATDREGGAILDDVVPVGIVNAICEYALARVSGVLSPTPTNVNSGLVKRTRNKVGELETETEYVDGGSVKTYPSYPAADALMARYTRSASNAVSR